MIPLTTRPTGVPDDVVRYILELVIIDLRLDNFEPLHQVLALRTVSAQFNTILCQLSVAWSMIPIGWHARADYLSSYRFGHPLDGPHDNTIEEGEDMSETEESASLSPMASQPLSLWRMSYERLKCLRDNQGTQGAVMLSVGWDETYEVDDDNKPSEVSGKIRPTIDMEFRAALPELSGQLKALHIMYAPHLDPEVRYVMSRLSDGFVVLPALASLRVTTRGSRAGGVDLVGGTQTSHIGNVLHHLSGLRQLALWGFGAVMPPAVVAAQLDELSLCPGVLTTSEPSYIGQRIAASVSLSQLAYFKSLRLLMLEAWNTESEEEEIVDMPVLESCSLTGSSDVIQAILRSVNLHTVHSIAIQTGAMYPHENDAILQCLADLYLPKLSMLRIHLPAFLFRVLPPLLGAFDSLTHLDMKGCPSTDDIFRYLGGAGQWQSKVPCPKLERLDLARPCRLERHSTVAGFMDMLDGRWRIAEGDIAAGRVPRLKHPLLFLRIPKLLGEVSREVREMVKRAAIEVVYDEAEFSSCWVVGHRLDMGLQFEEPRELYWPVNGRTLTDFCCREPGVSLQSGGWGATVH